MKLKFILLSLALWGTQLIAQTEQNPIFCGFDYYLRQQKQHAPRAYEGYVDLFNQSKGTLFNNRDGVLVVPVVFHIVYHTEAQNLPDSVIHSQMEVLNEDYRRLNADAANTRDVFLPVAADTEIEFRLATIDPQGQPTNGITHTYTERTGFSMDLFSMENTLDEVKSSETGGVDCWDPTKYLNIWVCYIEPTMFGQIFGMAYPPNGLPNWENGSGAPTPETEGVIVHYTVVGRNNPRATDDNVNDNDLGRTLTHEVGHYLGLRHIWGDEFMTDLCSEDDGIDDTPWAGNSDQFVCNHNSNSCFADQPNDLPDMIENYMDYTRESCYNIFTNGQKEHMRYVLQEKRPGLLTGEVLGIKNKAMQSVSILVSPNPTREFITVQSRLGRNAHYVITNMMGEQVMKGQLNTPQISVAHLSSGIYLFHGYDGISTGVQRFVVE